MNKKMLLLFLLFCSGSLIVFSQKGKQLTASDYALQDVRLLPSPFTHAMQKDREWLLALEPDRLLSGFRSEAGLQPKAPKYGGWESQGVAGQTLGHYLSACAFMYAATGDTTLLHRLNYMVDELSVCQNANGNGYVAALPGGKKVFEEIARGDIRSKGFDLNGGWVPWYVIHKLCAGLIDTYRITGNEKAKTVLIKLADWAIEEHKNLSYAQMQSILRCEQGGISESFADVYALTGNKKYLQLARRFNDDALLRPLAEQKDILPGLHANTQIPKIIGIARQYELDKEVKDSAIAGYFWRTVVSAHSYANGGNSEAEHFGMPHQVASRLSNKTTETCNSYNMLKLTHHLFDWTPNVIYADYYEKTLYNHILGSQNPDDGMVTYFTPLAAGYRKSFSTPFESFWCCVGTGLENHGKYGEFIYSRSSDGGAFVNLFIPSVLTDKQNGFQLKMETRYPEDTVIHITVHTKREKIIPLYLRIPSWAEGSWTEIRINDAPVKTDNYGGRYFLLRHRWKDGDKITMKIPFRLRLERTPDDPKIAALYYGPLLLSADLGKDFRQGIDSVPVIVTEESDPAKWLQRGDGALAFRTLDATYPARMTFTPFYGEIKNPYQVYFAIFTPKEWAKEAPYYFNKAAQEAQEKRNTVDDIQLGEMQPERDHDFQGEKTETGILKGYKYRMAAAGGWFSFRLKVLPDAPQKLVLTYPGGVSNESGFDILLDGKLLASDAVHWLDGNSVDKSYTIPPDMLSGKNIITIQLLGKPGKIAGELIRARIVKDER